MMLEAKIVDQLSNVHHAGTLSEPQSLCPGAIIFLGPPGAGKGTQAQHIAHKYSLPHISTGDVFRTHVANKTALGLHAADVMKRGMLVADDVVCNMLAEYIHNLDYAGCLVLDGFPRSVPQAEWLDQFLNARTAKSHNLPRNSSLAIQINVTHDQLLLRLSGRRSCPSCGRVYNLHFQPPRNSEMCDGDGARLLTRADDSEDVILKRLMIHEQDTSPVTEYYRYKGQLREIDGNSPAESVRATITGITKMLTL
jgi:adenylate kinase